MKLYSGKSSGGIWKLIRVVESPPPSRNSPPPPPAVVNVQIPKVEVSVQIPNYTVETFGNTEKTEFCRALSAASNYPTGKRTRSNMVWAAQFLLFQLLPATNVIFYTSYFFIQKFQHCFETCLLQAWLNV